MGGEAEGGEAGGSEDSVTFGLHMLSAKVRIHMFSVSPALMTISYTRRFFQCGV